MNRLVAYPRQLCSGFRSAARGWQGATTEDTGSYREYLREEQRSQPGCPARKALYKWRGQATKRQRSKVSLGARRPAREERW